MKIKILTFPAANLAELTMDSVGSIRRILGKHSFVFHLEQESGSKARIKLPS